MGTPFYPTVPVSQPEAQPWPPLMDNGDEHTIRVDEMFARRLDTEFASGVRDLLHHPETGLSALKGEAALEAIAGALPELDPDNPLLKSEPVPGAAPDQSMVESYEREVTKVVKAKIEAALKDLMSRGAVEHRSEVRTISDSTNLRTVFDELRVGGKRIFTARGEYREGGSGEGRGPTSTAALQRGRTIRRRRPTKFSRGSTANGRRSRACPTSATSARSCGHRQPWKPTESEAHWRRQPMSGLAVPAQLSPDLRALSSCLEGDAAGRARPHRPRSRPSSPVAQ